MKNVDNLPITVFLDSSGRPISSCAAGNEVEYLDPENETSIASQVNTTVVDWHAWVRRNDQAEKRGMCIPWQSES